MISLANAGHIVVSDFGFYNHHAIISNCIGNDGRPMLISLTKKNGTVKEENWTTVTQGRPTRLLNVDGPLSPLEALQRARSQIGKSKYSLLRFNCEHFARWTYGLPVESQQVGGGIIGAGLGYAIASSRGSKPVASCLAALALGVIGIAMMKKS